MKKILDESKLIIGAGLITGVIASALTLAGNPLNMGFCIACFLRDTAGALGLHNASALCFVRPEIIGIVLGAFIAAALKGEFKSKGGACPVTRFTLGFFAMTGCLMFMGCPLRMTLRLAGGDGNALFGLAGLICGVGLGVFFLNKGFSLKRNALLTKTEGGIPVITCVILLILLIAFPSVLKLTKEGEGAGAVHAFVYISLLAGIIVGVLAQRSRLCLVGGIRDIMLFKDFKLVSGFIAIFAGAFIMNIILGILTGTKYFNPGFAGQPAAHTEGLWNLLGMLLTGFCCVLLGGCPMRQLVLTGEGNTDSAVTVLGFVAGAAICHNFGLASGSDGVTFAGKTAVIIGIAATLLIAVFNSSKSE